MSLLKAKLKNRLLRARLGSRELSGLARANLDALDSLSPGLSARGVDFAVVDLETTGMDVKTDRVVCVGAVRVRQGRVLVGDHFFELIDPGRGIPAESIKIHHIKPDQVANARKASEVFSDFLAWLKNSVLVAHYARFDLHFINLTMRRLYGFELQNYCLDTVRMCESTLLSSDPYGIGRGKQRCSLETLCRRFGINQGERHSALGDAMITALIFQRMLAGLEQKGKASFKDLARAAAVY